MRLLPVVVTGLLTVAFAYYVYTPLPDAIQEPWKLMMMDAGFRATMHLASLKAWLGFDHYITSIRQSMDGFDGMVKRSESGAGVMPGVKVSDITFAGIPVRVYEPPAGGEGHLRRGLMFLHGGGWALGSAKKGSYDAINRMLSDELNTVVVSVEYRMYPEVHFPLPYLDCLAAAKHFLSPEVLARYAVDPERVAVSGDSAGGNLAAAVSQEISTDDTMSVKFSVQALIYPVLQALDFNTPSYLQNQYIPILYRTLMVRFWLQYLGADLNLESQFMANNHSSLHHSKITPELRARLDWTVLLSPKHKKNYKPVIVEKGSEGLLKAVPGLLDVRAAPLLAGPEVLAKCPRAYLLTCENDVLRDDGLMYARRLQDAGVAVTSDHYEDGFHGCFSFIAWPFEFDVGKRACLGLIILAAILLQTIAVAVSFMYFNKVLNTMQESFSRSSVSCLINANLRSESEGSAEDKKSDPCWQVTKQLHYHIEKTMADRFQKEISTAMRDKLTGVLPVLDPEVRGVPLPKVAAHVTGVSSSTELPTTDGLQGSRGYLGERIRAWEGQRGLSFLQNMELRGGELLVPRAGLYYIYAQTYFRLPSTEETDGETGEAKEEEGAQLVQYIYKKMSSYPVPLLLMKSSRSACWPRGQEPGLFSLHQAGTAFLQPADRLFITVSNASTMEMDGRASYFGAFLVG
ncbi:Neutral cholesterol ester hydrolase 1 [Nibea albiflora]|uniref:Neutral cholesterol ester hydrolase 1 n=1 Tax=Nibea albiflora TaxID=240163 RepID=A0ACB7FG92_NIBAL|nr:Neutral cholesterol ester hydrolase 1 [Nibea albiflora]